MKPITTFGIAVGAALFSMPAQATSLIDACAPALKQDEISFTFDMAANLAYMNTINRSNFNQQSAKAALSAVIKNVPVTFDFDYFAEKRSELLQATNYNYSVEQQKSFLARYLSSSAANAYATCVTQTLKNPGVYLEMVSDLPAATTLRLFFQGSQDASAPYNLNIDVVGGELMTVLPTLWKGAATQLITVRKDVAGGNLIINANALLQGLPKYGDSLMVTKPIVYVRKESGEPVQSENSTARCGGNGSGDTTQGTTVYLQATGPNETLVSVIPVTVSVDGSERPAGGDSGMKLLSNDGKVAAGRTLCNPTSKNATSAVVGHLAAIRQTVVYEPR